MTRKAYLKKLIQLGRTGDALEELSQIADGTYYENTSILLMGQYNGLKQDAMLISSEQRSLRINRLLASTKSLMDDLVQEVPGQFEEEVEVDPDKLKAPEEPTQNKKPSTDSSQSKVEHHYHIKGNVGSITSDIKGDVTQHIDQSTTLYEASTSMPLKELVEAEQQAGYISEDEYEELMEILADIQEDLSPKDEKEKKRWKRWLGKMAKAGADFAEKRIGKATDVVIGKNLEKWLEGGGIDQLKAMIEAM